MTILGSGVDCAVVPVKVENVLLLSLETIRADLCCVGSFTSPNRSFY